jgi:hypothetical protein
MGRVSNLQKDYGIAWHYNSFWIWPFASEAGLYDAIGFDRLHVCKGLILKCVDTLNGISQEEKGGGDQAKSTHLTNNQAILDHRIACTPAYHGAVFSLIHCMDNLLHSFTSEGVLELQSLVVPHQLLYWG